MRYRASRDQGNEAGTQSPKPRWHPVFAPSRRGIIGMVVAGALVVGGGLTAAIFLASGPGSSGRPAADDGLALRATAGASAQSTASAAPAMPQVVSSPHVATMPSSAARAAGSRGASASASASASHPAGSTGPAPSGSSAPSGSPASSDPATSRSASCTHPSYSTSAADGMLNASPYFVSNNMWNASGYSVSQTLYACSYSNWYVTATMNNNNGDGAVKTYPNSPARLQRPPSARSAR